LFFEDESQAYLETARNVVAEALNEINAEMRLRLRRGQTGGAPGTAAFLQENHRTPAGHTAFHHGDVVNAHQQNLPQGNRPWRLFPFRFIERSYVMAQHEKRVVGPETVRNVELDTPWLVADGFGRSAGQPVSPAN
jgi:hypothetical protein